MLTLEKLQQFLQHNGFSPIRYYTAEQNRCMFVEIMSIRTVEFILLQIPPNYGLNVQPGNNVFPLIQAPQSHTDDLVQTTESFVQQTYTVEDHLSLSMSDDLNESYRRNMVIEDLKGKDKTQTAHLSRQLQRLRYCIQGMPHKLAILHFPFVGVLQEDDAVTVYISETLPRKNTTPRLMLLLQFKLFYDKIEVIDHECAQIISGIHSVLSNHHMTHTRNMQQILERKHRISDQSQFLQTCAHRYQDYIVKYKELLDNLNTYELNKVSELRQLRETQADTMHRQMRQTRQQKLVERELSKMQTVKKELIDTLSEVKMKNDHLLLEMDSILFDNIVMMDRILRNLETLSAMETKLGQ